MTAGQRNAVAAGQWLISDQGQQLGPYGLDQMKQMIREGRMPPGALVWMPGMAEWKPWQQTPEFELLASVGGWAGPLRQASKGQVIDYLVFRRLILPIMIQVLFWLGLLILGITGLNFFRLAWAAAEGFAESIVILFTFGFGFVVVALFWRCLCEVMILFYRINETLTDVKNAIEKQGG